MATIRTAADLLALYVDNDLGLISEGDGRDLIASALPIVKSANEQSITDVFTNDDDLHFEIVQGGFYTVVADLIVWASSAATGEIRLRFDVPAGATMRWGLVQSIGGVYGANLTKDEGDEVSRSEIDNPDRGVYTSLYGTIDASGMAGPTGTVSLQFANTPGETGPCAIYAGSLLRVSRAA